MYRVAAQTKSGSQDRKSILMTRRKTNQKGAVIPLGGGYTLRYRELDDVTGRWSNRGLALGKFKDIDAACLAAKPIMTEVNERNNLEPQQLDAELSFKEFVEIHWKTYQRRKHQPTTIENHNSLIKNHLMPIFKNTKLREIQPSDIGRFLQAKVNEQLADNTLQNLYGLLRLMFDIAAQTDFIDKSRSGQNFTSRNLRKSRKSHSRPRKFRPSLPGCRTRQSALLHS